MSGDSNKPTHKRWYDHDPLLVEVLEPGTVRVLWRALNRGTVATGTVTPSRLDRVARDTLESLPAAPPAS